MSLFRPRFMTRASTAGRGGTRSPATTRSSRIVKTAVTLSVGREPQGMASNSHATSNARSRGGKRSAFARSQSGRRTAGPDAAITLAAKPHPPLSEAHQISLHEVARCCVRQAASRRTSPWAGNDNLGPSAICPVKTKLPS